MTARMTPAYRAELTAKAKSKAVPVASCVAARIPITHLVGDMTRDELLALVIVLAEAHDPVRLRVVVQSADDGLSGTTDADLRLLAAHREAVRLREAKQPVPLVIRHLDSAYREARKKARRALSSVPAQGAAPENETGNDDKEASR